MLHYAARYVDETSHGELVVCCWTDIIFLRFLSHQSSLLLYLDEYAQKAFVLCEFADSKLSSIYPDGPHQPAWASSTSSSHHQTAGSMDRQRSLSLSASSTHATASTEAIANEALQIYLKSLSFLLRGIEVVRGYLEMKGSSASGALSSSPTISQDLNEGEWTSHDLRPQSSVNTDRMRCVLLPLQPSQPSNHSVAASTRRATRPTLPAPSARTPRLAATAAAIPRRQSRRASKP